MHRQHLNETIQNAAVRPMFKGMRGDGSVAIDDVKVLCGGEDADSQGTCMCKEGYDNTGDAVAMKCTAIKGETENSPENVIPAANMACPRAYEGCDVRKACEAGDIEPACAFDRVYKNRACATCNGELMPYVHGGMCKAIPADDDVAGKCQPGWDKVYDAMQGTRDHFRLRGAKAGCTSGKVDTVCAGNVNYKNYDCALCNSVNLKAIKDGFCSWQVDPKAATTLPPKTDCDYWEACAKNGETCTCKGDVRVNYYIGRSMIKGSMILPATDGTIECSTKGFNALRPFNSVRGCECNTNSDLEVHCRGFNGRLPECEGMRDCMNEASGEITFMDDFKTDVDGTPFCMKTPYYEDMATKTWNYVTRGCAVCTHYGNKKATVAVGPYSDTSGFCEAPAPDLSGRVLVRGCKNTTTFKNYNAAQLRQAIDRCANGQERPACGRGTNYKNQDCAVCNDIPYKDVTQEPCSATQYQIIDNCTADAKPQLAALCQFEGFRPVCGHANKALTNTYKNKACAECNGLSQPEWTRGSCNNAVIFNKQCDQLQCADNARCSILAADCDFESGMCGWTNEKDFDDFNWATGKGSTPTDKTGPDADHTKGVTVDTGDAPGTYAFAEASEAQVGHTAAIVSPQFNAAEFGYSCRLSYHYMMYGADVGTLEVKIKRVDVEQQWETVHVHTAPVNSGSDSHKKWVHHEISLKRFREYGTLQAKIVATAGGNAGDIAIDDVALICGQKHEDDKKTEGSCLCDGGYEGDGEKGGTGCKKTEPVTIATTAMPVPAVTYVDAVGGVNCPGKEMFVCAVTGTQATTYKNEACAKKDGKTGVTEGVCGQTMLSTCPKDTNVILASMCQEFGAVGGGNYVCGDDGVTYASKYCAECNSQYSFRRGICNAPFVHSPCEDYGCGAGSVCTTTVADCDFENDMCGWRNTKGDGDFENDEFDWIRWKNSTRTDMTGPSIDHTKGDATGKCRCPTNPDPRVGAARACLPRGGTMYRLLLS